MDKPFSSRFSLPFSLDRSPGYQINRLARDLSFLLQQLFRDGGYDITPPQWTVLNRLWEEEGLHQSELASRIVKDRHNMARILAGMERQGLIQRRPDKEDKRLQRVYLTEQGRGLQGVLNPIALRAGQIAFAGVSDQELAALQSIYKKVLANLNG